LQDFYPRLVSDLHFEEVEKLYRDVDGLHEFNPIQTQAFDKLYLSDDSVFLGAPSGSNLLVCAELAMFRELQSEDGGKILYIAPNEFLCKSVFAQWKRRL
jgi:pre-mRNA-splicing helicase BRR2